MMKKCKLLICAFILFFGSHKTLASFIIGIGIEGASQHSSSFNGTYSLAYPLSGFLGISGRIGVMIKNRHMITANPMFYFSNAGHRINQLRFDYSFIINPKQVIGLYPIAGFSFYQESFNGIYSPQNDFYMADLNKISLLFDIGFGAMLNKKVVRPFFEVRYGIGRQFEASVGVIFKIK